MLDGDEKQKQVPRFAYPICDGAPKRSARDDKSKFFFDRKSVGWVEMKSEKQVPRSAYPICDGAQGAPLGMTSLSISFSGRN